MLNDNEENAEISIKALIEMQKFYKTVYDVIVNITYYANYSSL